MRLFVRQAGGSSAPCAARAVQLELGRAQRPF
eukprot:SAG11_NODE_34531_length_271_cov_0.906977_1_plen_31_part_01